MGGENQGVCETKTNRCNEGWRLYPVDQLPLFCRFPLPQSLQVQLSRKENTPLAKVCQEQHEFTIFEPMSVVLITGCSSGFGMLAAARLASGGHTVYATMRNLDKKGDLLAESTQRGGEVRILELDVTEDASTVSAMEQIERDEGRLDVLINNAGYAIGGFFEDLSEQEIRDQMETNFFGVQKVIRAALPLMRKTATEDNCRTKILNISSVSGRSSFPGLGAYGASKFALEGFSESLYHELLPFGIDVVLIEPGSYRTKIFTENAHKAQKSEDPASHYFKHTHAFRDQLRRMIKSKNGMGDPEDVAALIERVVNTKKPKLRYLIGRQSRLRLIIRALLPDRTFSSMMHKRIFGELD